MDCFLGIEVDDRIAGNLPYVIYSVAQLSFLFAFVTYVDMYLLDIHSIDYFAWSAWLMN